MSRTYRTAPVGVVTPRATRDGFGTQEPGQRYAKRIGNRRARRNGWNNRERRAAFIRDIY